MLNIAVFRESLSNYKKFYKGEKMDDLNRSAFYAGVLVIMAEGKMLQIIIFSIFFGVALRSIKDTNSQLIKIMESVTNVVMKMVFILINLAPFGVFCLMANLFAIQGVGVIGNLFQYFLLVIFVLHFSLLSPNFIYYY